MRKIMPFTASIAIMVVASMFTVAGMMAAFSDSEMVGGHALDAATLDLEVGSSAPITIVVANMKPGDDTGYYKWKCRNAGSISGKLYVDFSAITNAENGLNDPETKAGDAGEPGELGQYLKYTIGWAPFSWSVPSTLISQWQTGPPHPWGVPGLNGLGGTTTYYGVLAAGGEIGFFMKLSLDANLLIWDGTKWIEVNDNIIQGDGVTFTITFRLEQE